MPELDYAFLADYARSKNGSLDALSIGINTIGAVAIPSTVQMVLVLRLALDRIDCESLHHIATIVQDPDGARLAELQMEAQAQWPDVEPPGNRVNVELLMPISLSLASRGPYSVDLTIDGTPEKTISFNVV